MIKYSKEDLSKLKNNILNKRENILFKKDASYKKKAFDFSEGYKGFLNKVKTEREIVNEVRFLALNNGFKDFNSEKIYSSGDRFFVTNKERNIFLVIVGENGIKQGARIIVSHIDAPRIDLKPVPIYESGGLVYFKTQYYGGIKKYQWTSLPLALHGKIIKENNEIVDIKEGEFDDDHCFCITDLLPHLAQEQMTKPMNKAIEGESLKLLIGSESLAPDIEDAAKLCIINLLNKKYGLHESDFVFSELQIVPALQAKDVGFDRSMIGSYAHDDRCCSFAGIQAFLDTKAVNKTSILALVDKEEVGSEGDTSSQSIFLLDFLNILCENEGLKFRDISRKTKCISGDVEAAYDPIYPDKFDPDNSAYMNNGVAIVKYTGHRGKLEASDASVEFLSFIRKIFKENDVYWQTGSLGKVDTGGGGTVAKYFSRLNMDVVDIGIPVLSMHSPFEVISKLDLYELYRGFKAFIRSCD
ncbi:MAG: aminopeptidase [Candidatus Improbicoccus pseudotrichonymphae]|uniref:M18 family aminopeptidase n=1 Tax=Candidatus Improbicoccus pseudotrichonymphae TaxID=3033792 RepID=A0AA48KYP9_9FIRM|nr:MAG: aminopeptidase [Candidatus Improbicoccus pseudotrichonymphae]